MLLGKNFFPAEKTRFSRENVRLRIIIYTVVQMFYFEKFECDGYTFIFSRGPYVRRIKIIIYRVSIRYYFCRRHRAMSLYTYYSANVSRMFKTTSFIAYCCEQVAGQLLYNLIIVTCLFICIVTTRTLR